MQVQYSDIAVTFSNGRAAVSLQAENLGGDAWEAQRGDSIGCQIYDADNDNYLEEGPHQLLEQPVAPGASRRLKLDLETPSETGRYRLLVSLLREGEGWFFEQGSPFVLLEIEVADGDVRLLHSTSTTSAALGRRRWARTALRAFRYPIATILANWSLIRSMVRRDIVGRYRGSYGGLFWTVFHPLLLMLTYWFVFGVVLRTRFGEDGRSSNFVLYFLAGMLPWLALSEAVGRAPTVLIEHATFVKKLVFPLDILPVNLVIAGLVSEAFGAAIFLVGMIGFGHVPTSAALFLPLLLIPQFLLSLGLCWLLAALGVFFRDLGQLIGFALTVWFFTTPICYSEDALPESARWLFELNPMYVLVRGYRSVLLEAAPPDWAPLAGLTLVSGALFLLGYASFYKLRRSFVDLL